MSINRVDPGRGMYFLSVTQLQLFHVQTLTLLLSVVLLGDRGLRMYFSCTPLPDASWFSFVLLAITLCAVVTGQRRCGLDLRTVL